ncbi:MAG: MlaD family protein [Thiogranum sp.]|nr:MlaD family protein [Thiogranum sp.]
MEARANYILIGAFTLAVAIAAVLFGLYAARFATESAWDRYLILFTGSVIGLSDGSSVLYSGVKVGRVASLKLNPADVREVLVIVEIEPDVPVHEDTVATIRLTGLAGTTAIQLQGGGPDSPLLQSRAGELPRIEAVDSPLNRLLESSEGIIVSANSIMTQIDAVLSEDNKRNFAAILAALQQFTARLADPESPINRLLNNTSEASETFPELVSKLDSAATRIDQLAGSIDRELATNLPEIRESLIATLTSLETLSARVDAIVASNQDGLTGIGGGLEDLRRLVRDLSILVQRLETDPSRFLRGGNQPEEYQPR